MRAAPPAAKGFLRSIVTALIHSPQQLAGRSTPGRRMRIAVVIGSSIVAVAAFLVFLGGIASTEHLGEKKATNLAAHLRDASQGSELSAQAHSLLNEIKQDQRGVGKINMEGAFAKDRIKRALLNAHRDLSAYNQGIRLADVESFLAKKTNRGSSASVGEKESPPKQQNSGERGTAEIFSAKSNKIVTPNIDDVTPKHRWQEAYAYLRARSRTNVTLPPHPSNGVEERARELDEALDAKERIGRPLIHQAIEDSDKTKFGDAGGNVNNANQGEVEAAKSGGDVISVSSGLVVVPGAIVRDDTIFITVASYRDPECAPTILDMFSKARYPRALTVGIAVQNDKDDASCIPKEFLTNNDNCQTKYGFCPTDNIRTRVVSHRDAKGPTFGRYLGMLLYRGERYIFMIDSHNRFVTNWDFIVVNMYKRLEVGDFGSYDDEEKDAAARAIFKYTHSGSVYSYVNGGAVTPTVNTNSNHEGSSVAGHETKKSERRRRSIGKYGISKPVLSHYPEAWFHPNEKDGTNRNLDQRATTTYMCRGKFLDWGVFRLDGNVVSRPRRPLPQGWAAAGFLFARGELLSEVPFDPYLDYVFDGEEITYSIRMWTHGWDIFSPNENILYHYYGRKSAKRFWEVVPGNWTARKAQGEARIQHLLKATPKGSGVNPSIPRIPLQVGVGSENAVSVPSVEGAQLSLHNTTHRMPLWAREIELYGLGAERPLAAYYAWAGLNPVTREFKDGWFCSRKS